MRARSRQAGVKLQKTLTYESPTSSTVQAHGSNPLSRSAPELGQEQILTGLASNKVFAP